MDDLKTFSELFELVHPESDSQRVAGCDWRRLISLVKHFHQDSYIGKLHYRWVHLDFLQVEVRYSPFVWRINRDFLGHLEIDIQRLHFRPDRERRCRPFQRYSEFVGVELVQSECHMHFRGLDHTKIDHCDIDWY